MIIDYVLLFSILSISKISIVRARHAERTSTSANSKSGARYDEMSSEFILTGNIRRYYAVEAMMASYNRDIVCSPLVAMLQLGKLAYGAVGKTRSDILAAVGVDTGEQLRSRLGGLTTELRHLPSVSLDIANTFFVPKDLEIRQEFTEKCSRSLRSCYNQINCEDHSEAVKTVNKWVTTNTRGKITTLNIPNNFCNETSFILTSAVYFKGEWQKPFHRTYRKDFYVREEPLDVRKVPMMIKDDIFRFATINMLNAEVVEIPYKSRGASMILILPYSSDDIHYILEFIQQAPSALNSIIKTLRPKEVVLGMPKFKITSEVDMKHLYEKVGVWDSYNSDLINISDNKTLHLSKAIQKTTIQFAERGTEDELPVEKHFGSIEVTLDKAVAYADHPFLFYIMVNGEQLFAGIFTGSNL